MLWSKKTSEIIRIKDYMDQDRQELINTQLKLVDHNEMIYIYKRECEVPEFGVYFTQYYFKTNQRDTLSKLTKENLVQSYRNSEFILELKLFLSSNEIIKLNQYGHLCLFDVINTHACKKAYQLLQYEVLDKARVS